MFEFGIINCPDGSQVIDEGLKTPDSALDTVQLQEYQEIEVNLRISKRLKIKAQREAERRMKRERNPFYKLASACGLLL